MIWGGSERVNASGVRLKWRQSNRAVEGAALQQLTESNTAGPKTLYVNAKCAVPLFAFYLESVLPRQSLQIGDPIFIF